MRGPFHHIDMNARDLAASKPIYDLLLTFLGYQLVKDEPEMCEWDLSGSIGFQSLGLRQAEPGPGRHERYAPGLHHLAWHAESREDVDRFHRLLIANAMTVLDAPAEYPQYSPGYYAVFFEDPDGIKLELVHTPPP